MVGGVNLAKSNDQKQFNVSSRLAYETPGYSVAGELNSLFSTQRESDDTSRHSVTARFGKNIGRRWGIGLLNSYLRNAEQDLDLRTVVGGGPAMNFVRNQQFDMTAIGGVVWNNERLDPEAGKEVNNELEGLGGIEFSFFQFKQWELTSAAFVFPSFTTSGRVRSSISANLRVRLIRGKSFWFKLSQTLDLDSQPPADTQGTDYVTTTSISYDFP